MKVIEKIFATTFCFFLICSCEFLIESNEKPEARERNIDFNVHLIDATGSFQMVYGNENVKGAQVLLKSITLGTEYSFLSDENGLITISNVISDLYLISAKRRMTPDEMEVITGQRLDFYKLVNFSTGTIDLRADNPKPIELYLDKLILDSPLVISEIYACGPEGSGLYYHDKYMEVYNQSDSIAYLDGLIVAVVYASSYLGLNYVDDPEFVHSKRVWTFPGSGNDYPIQPGEFKVCAEDAIDHRINAPNSVDLSQVGFEFYKDDAPDIDNPAIPNMIKIYQTSGNDWLIGGEKGAIVIAQMDVDSLQWYDDQMLVPYRFILDGVEYLDDVTRIDKKILNPGIDAGGTGGIQFYTGKTMERIPIDDESRIRLKDDNNSSLDLRVYDHPSPEYHNELN